MCQRSEGTAITVSSLFSVRCCSHAVQRGVVLLLVPLDGEEPGRPQRSGGGPGLRQQTGPGHGGPGRAPARRPAAARGAAAAAASQETPR